MQKLLKDTDNATKAAKYHLITKMLLKQPRHPVGRLDRLSLPLFGLLSPHFRLLNKSNCYLLATISCHQSLISYLVVTQQLPLVLLHSCLVAPCSKAWQHFVSAFSRLQCNWLFGCKASSTSSAKQLGQAQFVLLGKTCSFRQHLTFWCQQWGAQLPFWDVLGSGFGSSLGSWSLLCSVGVFGWFGVRLAD